MKNITLSADERLIEAARERAKAERTTLNNAFRRWLEVYTNQKSRSGEALTVIADLRQRVRTGGRRFSREEMNER